MFGTNKTKNIQQRPLMLHEKPKFLCSNNWLEGPRYDRIGRQFDYLFERIYETDLKKIPSPTLSGFGDFLNPAQSFALLIIVGASPWVPSLHLDQFSNTSQKGEQLTLRSPKLCLLDNETLRSPKLRLVPLLITARATGSRYLSRATMPPARLRNQIFSVWILTPVSFHEATEEANFS